MNTDWIPFALTAMTILGTMAMSVSAVAQASRADMDPFGAMVLAGVAALGGGTLRDLLLGTLPVFWVQDMLYIGVIFPTAAIAIFWVKRITPGRGQRVRVLDYCDALGLALFCIVGAGKALDVGTAPVIAVLMGAITGIAGGMARDVLCQQSPAVMSRDLYGTCAFAGAAVYVIARGFELPEVPVMLLSMTVTFGLRVYAIHTRWSEKRIHW